MTWCGPVISGSDLALPWAPTQARAGGARQTLGHWVRPAGERARKGGARYWKLLAGCGSEGTDLAWPGRAGPRTGAGGDRARHLQKSDGGASRLRGVWASCEASPDLSVPGGAADRADSRVAERQGRRPFRAPSRARTRAHQSASERTRAAQPSRRVARQRGATRTAAANTAATRPRPRWPAAARAAR